MRHDASDQRYEGLRWGASAQDRFSAMQYWSRSSPAELRKLILPKAGKEYWEGAAAVFALRSQSEIEQLLPDLMEWLRDLNWPGAEIIFNLIRQFPSEKLNDAIAVGVKKAIEENDGDWKENLKLLKP